MFPSVNAHGYFGSFGGRFVPETLMAPLAELACRRAARELLEHLDDVGEAAGDARMSK